MVRQSPRKAKPRPAVVEEDLVPTNGKQASVGEAELAAKQEPASKRKPADEADFEDDGSVQEAKKRTAKKRKTKTATGEENMPLAERTAATALRRSMYIGAHVSSAGGL
jgi:AP endonuclease-1